MTNVQNENNSRPQEDLHSSSFKCQHCKNGFTEQVIDKSAKVPTNQFTCKTCNKLSCFYCNKPFKISCHPHLYYSICEGHLKNKTDDKLIIEILAKDLEPGEKLNMVVKETAMTEKFEKEIVMDKQSKLIEIKLKHYSLLRVSEFPSILEASFGEETREKFEVHINTEIFEKEINENLEKLKDNTLTIYYNNEELLQKIKKVIGNNKTLFEKKILFVDQNPKSNTSENAQSAILLLQNKRIEEDTKMFKEIQKMIRTIIAVVKGEDDRKEAEKRLESLDVYLEPKNFRSHFDIDKVYLEVICTAIHYAWQEKYKILYYKSRQKGSISPSPFKYPLVPKLIPNTQFLRLPHSPVTINYAPELVSKIFDLIVLHPNHEIIIRSEMKFEASLYSERVEQPGYLVNKGDNIYSLNIPDIKDQLQLSIGIKWEEKEGTYTYPQKYIYLINEDKLEEVSLKIAEIFGKNDPYIILHTLLASKMNEYKLPWNFAISSGLKIFIEKEKNLNNAFKALYKFLEQFKDAKNDANLINKWNQIIDFEQENKRQSTSTIPEFLVEIHRDFSPALIEQISNFLTKVIKDNETLSNVKLNFNFMDEFGMVTNKSTLCLPPFYTFQQVSNIIKRLHITKFLGADPLFNYDDKLVSYSDTLEGLKVKQFDDIKVIDHSSLESFSVKRFNLKSFSEGEDTKLYKVKQGEVHIKPIKNCKDVPFHKHRFMDCQGVDGKKAIFNYTGNDYRYINHRMTFDIFNDSKNKLDNDFIKQLAAMYKEVLGSNQTDLPNKTFRCMKLSKMELEWYKESVGQHIFLPTFTFTSSKLADSFLSPGLTIMVFLLRPGQRDHVMDLKNVNIFGNDEEEILLNPCTKCLVKKVVEGEYPKIFLELEDGCCHDT